MGASHTVLALRMCEIVCLSNVTASHELVFFFSFCCSEKLYVCLKFLLFKALRNVHNVCFFFDIREFEIFRLFHLFFLLLRFVYFVSYFLSMLLPHLWIALGIVSHLCFLFLFEFSKLNCSLVLCCFFTECFVSCDINVL